MVAKALVAGGALALLASLFLPWSTGHLANLLVLFGALDRLNALMAARDAWHVFSVADVLLCALAVGALVTAFWTWTPLRRVVLLATIAGLAFVIDQALDPPSVPFLSLLGLSNATPAFQRVLSPSAGAGEALAITALTAVEMGLLVAPKASTTR